MKEKTITEQHTLKKNLSWLSRQYWNCDKTFGAWNILALFVDS